MKIGFFGNTNNYPFIVARAMRRLGHEVIFIIDRGKETKWDQLNRPENRYSDITYPYPDWIYDMSPVDFWYDLSSSTAKKLEEVIQLLRTCDAVFLNQHGPSLLPYIQKPAIVHLTGSDLEVLANFDYAMDQSKSFQPDKKIDWWKIRSRYHYLREKQKIKKKFFSLVKDQRMGISLASAVIYFAKGLIPHGDKMLAELGVTDERRLYFGMTDLEKILPKSSPQNSTIRLFNVARINWKPNSSLIYSSLLDNKGTDILIHGLNLFYQNTQTSLDIRLVKKGNDIEATQELIEKLGLSQQVTWLEEMSQQEVFQEYEKADIVVDNLGPGLWGMGALDAMATGRPVIANVRPDLIDPYIGEPSPICQATTPQEVCQQLQKLVFNAQERERIGLASRQYAEKYFSANHAANLCLEKLQNAMKP